jgi:hypothetical protein
MLPLILQPQKRSQNVPFCMHEQLASLHSSPG